MAGYAGGDRLTAAKLNVPVARMLQSVAQTLTTGVYAAATFTVEEFDTHSGHSTVTNTDQFVIPSGWAGIWDLSGGGAFVANATGSRGCRWTKNGSPIANSGVMLPNNGAGAACRIPAKPIPQSLAVGDIIRLELFQDSGGNLNTIISGDVGTDMNLEFRRSI